MKVYFSHVTDSRRHFIEKILLQFEKEIDIADKILLKPNIVSLEEYPTTTHPETLDTVISILKKKNKKIVVADGAAFSFLKMNVVRKHKLAGICHMCKVPIVDLNRTRMKRFRRSGAFSYSYKVSEYAFAYDYIISLPVLKIHNNNEVCFTGALKNQYGFFSARDKIRGHSIKKALSTFIAEINTIVKPDLFIVDAVKTLLNANEKRHGGREEKLGFMFAGKDPVSLDVYGYSLLGKFNDGKLKKKVHEIEYIKMAKERNLGSFEFELIKI